MKITDEVLEQYKQKYPDMWEKFKYNQKLWRQWVAAKEKERLARAKIQQITSKDRTRALIILASELIKRYPDEIKKIVEEKKVNMVQKKGGKDFDYAPLIIEEIEKASNLN